MQIYYYFYIAIIMSSFINDMPMLQIFCVFNYSNRPNMYILLDKFIEIQDCKYNISEKDEKLIVEIICPLDNAIHLLNDLKNLFNIVNTFIQ